MERGAPRTPLRFGRGAVEKWPTTPSFLTLAPIPQRSWRSLPSQRADFKSRPSPAEFAGHPPAGLPTLPGSKSILATPGAPPPSGKGAQAKSGRKLPLANCPQRKVLPDPGNRASALLPCRFFHPAEQRAGFGHLMGIIPSGKGAQAKESWKLPLADCPQRKILPGPGNRASALLPCRFFHPAGQRAGFGHLRGIIPSWKGAPDKSGRKLPLADCPQRKVLPGPGSWASALLPCRFFHPAGQRAGFGHLRGITLVQADDSQARADPELPPAGHLPQRTLPDPGNRPSTPLPILPSCRTASQFWPPQGHHPLVEGGPDQIGPETPPGRLSTAEGPAGPGQRAGFGHSRGITLVQADDSQARADPDPPAGHLPQGTLPDPGNRPPAPLPVYPPCLAANRSRLA